MKIKNEYIHWIVSHPSTGRDVKVIDIEPEMYYYYLTHGYQYLFEEDKKPSKSIKEDKNLTNKC